DLSHRRIRSHLPFRPRRVAASPEIVSLRVFERREPPCDSERFFALSAAPGRPFKAGSRGWRTLYLASRFGRKGQKGIRSEFPCNSHAIRRYHASRPAHYL